MSYIQQREFGLARHLDFDIYVIWPVKALLYVPLVIICVACTGKYLSSTLIGPVIAFLFGKTFGRSAIMSFRLSQPCFTVIGPVIALLHVSSSIILVARTGIYLRSTIILYHVPVPMATSCHMLGHICVSRLYFSTRVPLTP